MRKGTCFVACCKDFLKVMVKKKGLSLGQCWHRIVFTLVELILDLKIIFQGTKFQLFLFLLSKKYYR